MEQIAIAIDTICNRPIYRSMVEHDILLLEQMLKRLDEKYAICAEGIKARIAELQRVKECVDRRLNV